VEISSDFKELLQTFNDANVRYLIVGAHAVGYHGHPRGTRDFDIWVDHSPENAKHVFEALATFGAPLSQTTAEDFTGDDLIFQIGIEPVRVDVMTSISGVEFADAWPKRIEDELDGIPVAYIGKDDLVRNKRATGRHRDLADVEELLKSGE
jgi:predicted nucleotidyltransferase